MNTQITEDYVSFEVAKLLKEKGFDEQCAYMYNSQHKLYSTFEQCRQVTRNNSDWIRYIGPLNVVPIAVPTLQMAMKWLREVHNIHIYTFYANGWTFAILDLETGEEFTRRKDYSSEEACEAAIKYCLTNLI